MSFRRPSGRAEDVMRHVTFETGINPYAEGSCLVAFGQTRVMCTATVERGVPPFLRGKGEGWITAEYGMLPRSTHSRSAREAARGKQNGRTVEIQRLIGRSLRASVDLRGLGERQILIDCDVLNADGGTRTASISGGFVALFLAMHKLLKDRDIKAIPLASALSGVSCGVYKGRCVLDLDYSEDSAADADGNFVIAADGKLVEVQASAEGAPFDKELFLRLLVLAEEGAQHIHQKQREAILKATGVDISPQAGG